MTERAEDRISSLPDELLHTILVRLRSIRAAARTGVLSRRWRHVWARLPDFVLFGGDGSPPATFLDSVDAALAAYSAPTVKRLCISLPDDCPCVPAHRVAPWLRFGSQRVVGAFVLCLPMQWLGVDGVDADLELPSFAGAAIIRLILQLQWRLRLRPAGLFKALTSLEICCGSMEGSELTALVSTRCPRLRNLSLIGRLFAVFDVSIRSDSLHTLYFHVEKIRRLEIVAPRLEELNVANAIEFHVSAPNLAKVAWKGSGYDPRRHQFTDAGCHLRQLEIGEESILASLMQRFDKVDELELNISIPQGIAGYESFLNETNKLPKCETLNVYLWWTDHGLVPILLHLLRSCYHTKKFYVLLLGSRAPLMRNSCPSACPCRLAESHKSDNIALHSLEEVEIKYFSGSHEEVEFVEQLSRCTAAVLKKLIIDYTVYPASPLTKEMCEEVRSKCYPNVKVEFFVILDGRRVCFD
ncbi:hypothetical protein ACP70R_005672 [Stipagrostis hirtigluma subsp. patula]